MLMVADATERAESKVCVEFVEIAWPTISPTIKNPSAVDTMARNT